jgi:hypothetical protein
MLTNQPQATPIEHSDQSAGVAAFVGFFFALTGVLMATSITSIGKSGVPFFYLVFGLPILGLVFPDVHNDFDLAGQGVRRKVFFFVGIVGVAITGTTLLHLITVGPGFNEVTHLSSRLCFLVYLVIALRYVRGRILTRALIWLRRLLIVACAYGIYQIVAVVLGWPLFLDWLRNNPSFFMYGYDTAGWIGIARASSIYPEPSEATVPILVLFLLNLSVKSRSTSRIVGWTTLILFTVATFSREAWIALLAGVVVVLAFKVPTVARMPQTKRWLLLLSAFILFIGMPAWAFVQGSPSSDISTQERSGSIVLGVHMIMDRPILGFGWNSFGDEAQRYAGVATISVDRSIDFWIIHSMVVSYVQQAGLSGLALAALPFFLLTSFSTGPSWMTFSTLVSFIIAAEVGGDIGYSSLMWLWVALLINMSSADGVRTVEGETRGWKRRPYRQLASASQ